MDYAKRAKLKTPEPRNSGKMGEEQPEGGGMGDDALLQRGDQRSTREVRSNVSGSEGLCKSGTAQPTQDKIWETIADERRKHLGKYPVPLAEIPIVEETESVLTEAE